MDNPGDYSLAAVTVTTALSSQVQTGIDALAGMSSVTLEAVLSGGTGGVTFTAIVRTRIGSGGTWREIARFDFTTADSKSANVIATATASIAALAALSANSLLHGFLGTELDCVLSSTGTYTNTTFALRASVR